MIAVIGGGIAGLSAAYELAVRGVPFKLFEATRRLGGLIRTEHVDGFTIEAGADSMLAQKRAAIDLCVDLGLEPRLITTQHPRTAFVLHGGRLHPLPSPSVLGLPATWRGLLSFDLLPIAARARLALEPLVPRRGGDAESIGHFFGRRFGQATVDLLAQPLLGGIHSGDVNTLSLRALMPRLAAAEAAGSVLRWVRRVAAASDPSGAFRSLSAGMGELVDALRQRLPPDSIVLNAPVQAIERGWNVRLPDGDFPCSAVILAAPAHAAARILAQVDPPAAALCARTLYVSTASVVLAWPRAAVRHPLRGSGFVVARAGDAVRMNACTWASSKFEGRAPADVVLLRAFFGGAMDPAAVDLQDDDLIVTAQRELSEVLSIEGAPRLARVYRWRDAGAQHDVEHPARMAGLDRRLALLPGLFVTGSGFRSVGVPDCIADGRAAGAAAASTL
ncbi:MAG: protoporphyrinogen oxidase [Acidobacteria bacterium]|nr:protoporphyrinogen oxidase [Acidobacteriota bacterium]